ncbi:MAG: hypothetical protein M3Z23_12970 [Acidobacteriota bacterium]|nr:hypothetical protein [Acidobacteriota bacterium]
MQQETSHVGDDRLELYAMNRLSGVELENLEEHLLLCEPCQLRLDETENYVFAMRSSLAALRAAPEPESIWRKLRDAIGEWRLSPLPAFASALALVALVLGISTQLPRAGTRAASEEPVTVRLEAMKGEAANSVANRPLRLLLDGRGLSPASGYRLQIVDQWGKPVWEGIAASGSPEGTLRASVGKSLGLGTYFVRIFASGTGGEPVREFGLRVR